MDQTNQENHSQERAEQIFRLSSLLLLGLIFTAITAQTKEIKPQIQQNKTVQNLYTQIWLVDEANFINNGGYSPSQLTVIGNTPNSTQK